MLRHLANQPLKAMKNFRQCASFSTVEKPDPSVYVNQRKVYQEQLKDMRKVWSKEIESRKLALAQERAAEKEKIVLAKAIRLRENRKDSILRQAADKATKVRSAQEYKAHLAQNQIIFDERVRSQKLINQQLAAVYSVEKDLWLTESNVDAKITPQFFDAPSTTGLRVNDSEHWRYATHTINIERLKHVQNSNLIGSTSFTELLDKKLQRNSSRHLIIQDFLDPMIGTGADRARYRELLQKFQTKFQQSDAFEEMDDMNERAEEEVRSVESDLDEHFGPGESISVGNDDYHWVSEEDYDPVLHADYIQHVLPSAPAAPAPVAGRVNQTDEEDDEAYEDPAAAKQDANKKAALQAGKGRIIKGRMARKQVVTKKK